MAQGRQNITTNWSSPARLLKAHMDGFHHSPSSDLSGSPSRSEHRHCPASRGMRGGGSRTRCREMFTGHFSASAISLTAPPIFLFHQPNYDCPVIIISRKKKTFVYLFSVPLPPICKCHCLSVKSHLSVSENCFLLEKFYLNPSHVVCLKTRGYRENKTHYLYPIPVPVVTYITSCSI